MAVVVELAAEERMVRPVGEDGMVETRLDIVMVKTERMVLPVESEFLVVFVLAFKSCADQPATAAVMVPVVPTAPMVATYLLPFMTKTPTSSFHWNTMFVVARVELAAITVNLVMAELAEKAGRDTRGMF